MSRSFRTPRPVSGGHNATIGPKVLITVVAGVTASSLALAAAVIVLGRGGLPVTAVAIFWALALIYVGAAAGYLRAV